MMGRFGTQEIEEDELPRGFDDFDLRLGDVMRGERATLGKSLLDVQRDLKIKASYIAAIENADPAAFETPGFIAGYVRSYSRYLGLDPEWSYKAFCAEGNFETAHGMSDAASAKRSEAPRKEAAANDPFAGSPLCFVPERESIFSRIEPGAIGSLAVLAGLIGLLGYGGYAVLREVQKVHLVPVDQTPGVLADLDPLPEAPAIPTEDEAEAGVQASAADGFGRLYRPEALDVPVLEPRDEAIATLDPRSFGTLASADSTVRKIAETGGTAMPDMPEPAIAARTAASRGREAAGERAVQVVADNVPEVVMFAVRDSWVRVRAADGTVLYERIMKEGDRFVLPKTEKPATLRTGESGALYFAINGKPYGPVGESGHITDDLSLAAENLTDSYDVADLDADDDLARVVAELEQSRPRRPGRPAAAQE